MPFGRARNDEKFDTTCVEQLSVLHCENGTQTLTVFQLLLLFYHAETLQFSTCNDSLRL